MATFSSSDPFISPVAQVVQKGSVPFVRVESASQLEDDYAISHKLGEGTFGVVYEAISKATKDKCAIKKINKRATQSSTTGSSPKWLHEIGILAKVSHPNIVRLDAIIESENHVFMVMELCDGGTLQRSLHTHGKFSEPQVRGFMGELCNALAYLHSLNIVHRDLKLDNLLLKRTVSPSSAHSCHSSDEKHIYQRRSLKSNILEKKASSASLDSQVGKKILDSANSCAKDSSTHTVDQAQFPSKPVNDYSIKLADFGLSVELRKVESTMDDVCGTPIYMSPEIVRGRSYSKQCDVWSLGIIMHFLLTGRSPFRYQSSHADQENGGGGNTERGRDLLFQEILDWKGPQKSAPPQLWNGLSVRSKRLLETLLHPDPAYRFTAQETLHDPWLTGCELSGNAQHTNVLELMKKFHTASTSCLSSLDADPLSFDPGTTGSLLQDKTDSTIGQRNVESAGSSTTSRDCKPSNKAANKEVVPPRTQGRKCIPHGVVRPSSNPSLCTNRNAGGGATPNKTAHREPSNGNTSRR